MKIPHTPFWKTIYIYIFLEKRFLALLKIVYYDIVEAFFKRKAPEVNANFYVFESQCPKIMVSLKALKAKLSSIPSGVASLSTPSLNRNEGAENCHCRCGPLFDLPSWQCFRAHGGPLEAPLIGNRICSVWLGLRRASSALSLSVEEGRILRDYQR